MTVMRVSTAVTVTRTATTVTLERTEMQVPGTGGGSGVTDHGLLTGLVDDDHPQYTTTAEAQALVDTHVNDTSAADAGTAISYSGHASLAATNLDAAADEITNALIAHATDTSNVHGIADFSALATTSAVAAGYQPLDADLTDIAAISDAQGDIIVRGASGWERLAKSATSTHVLTAGASQPAWAAPAAGGGTAPQANRARFTFYGMPGFIQTGAGGVSGALTADSEYAAPFLITAETNITEIGVEVSTLVNPSTCIVGIRFDVDGVRGDVAYQSTGLDTSTTGLKAVTGSPLVVLDPGVYWWVVKPSAAIAVRQRPGGVPGSSYYATGDTNHYDGITAAGSAGALPATPPGPEGTNQFGQMLLFKWDLV